MPATVATVPTPDWVTSLGSTNLGHVDRVDIAMDYGLHSIVYHLHPTQSSNRLLLYHYGHGGTIGAGEPGWQETMRRFLDAGHDVMVFWMPLLGENSTVARNVPGYGSADVRLFDHDQMAVVLENGRGSFIRFFVEPVIVALNYAKQSFDYRDINMVGISGGGWTTHLCTALDPRIEYSFPVAGSLPLYLRVGPGSNGSGGDSEQTWGPLYEATASWLDLYILGSFGAGRQQVQVLNQFDSCCFAGVGYRTYEPFVANAVTALGSGLYRVHLDSTHTEHQISQAALDNIIFPEVANKPLSPVPQFLAVSAGALTSTRAVLVAELAVANADVSVFWDTSDKGKDAQAWSHTDFAPNACQGVAPGQTISNWLSGLAPGTTYYFRFYGTNQACATATWSAANKFTTGNTPLLPTHFSSKMKITFPGYPGGEALSNFPVLLAFSNNVSGSGFDYTGFASKVGGDLRFAAPDGTTPLNYEIEKWDTGGVSWVWVAIPSLTTNQDYIWAYWGNPEQTASPAYALDGPTWANNFAGVWHLKEDGIDTGTRALYLDSAPGGHPSDDFVSSTGKEGRVGDGQEFNGSSDFISVPDFDLVGGFTISAWIKTTQTGSDCHQIVARGNSDNYWGAYLCVRNSRLMAGGNNGAGWNSADLSGATVADGNWHYVAGVFEPGPSRVTGYVDGQKRLSQTVSFAANGYSPQNTKFGRNQAGSGQYWTGSLDEIQISSVPRSSNWIYTAWLNMASNSTFCGYGQVEPSNPNYTVLPHALTVTAEDKTKTYGQADPDFTVSYSGFVNGETESVLQGVLAISRAAGQDVGGYAIKASGLTSTNYAITFADGTLTIEKASATVVADAKSKVYGEANPALTAVVDGTVNGDTLAYTLGCAADATTGVGSSPITVSLGSNPNYAVTPTDALLTITAQTLTVVAVDAQRACGQTNPVFTATYSGFVNGQTKDVLGGELAFTCGAQTNSPAGSYSIEPSGLTAANYSITYSNGTLTVLPYGLTVRAEDKTKSYGQSDPGFTVSYSGFVNGETESVLEGVLAISRAAGQDVGGYAITPSGLTSTNYAITFAAGTLTIEKAIATVVAEAKSKVYGEANPELTAVVAGTVNGDTLAYTLGCAADATTGVGSSPITVTLGSNPNYAVTPTDALLTITAKALTVVAVDAQRACGQTNPVFTATYSGFVNEQTNDVLGGELAFTCGGETNSPTGSYPIEPSGLTAANYSITYSNGTLTVLPYALTVTAEDKTKTYGQADPAFTVSYSGFVNGESESVLGGELAFSREAGQDAGNYAITPSGLTSTNYAITFAAGTLSIEKASATVVAEAKSKVYGEANPELTAVVVGTVHGDTLAYTLGCAADATTGVGTTPITVTLGSNPNYEVTKTEALLTINPMTITVTADAQTKTYGDVDPALSYTSSPELVSGDSFAGALCRVAGEDVGKYAIQQGTLALGDNYSLTFVPADLIITRAYSDTALVSSENPSLQGSNVTFTATVTQFTPAAPTPTGSVQFYTNGVVCGIPTPLSDGVATLTIALTQIGFNTVDAVYEADDNFIGSRDEQDQLVHAIPQTPITAGIKHNGGGSVTVSFSGTPYVDYVVQACGDLAAPVWTNVSTNMAGADGRWTFTELMDGHSSRFYRSAKP